MIKLSSAPHLNLAKYPIHEVPYKQKAEYSGMSLCWGWNSITAVFISCMAHGKTSCRYLWRLSLAVEETTPVCLDVCSLCRAGRGRIVVLTPFCPALQGQPARLHRSYMCLMDLFWISNTVNEAMLIKLLLHVLERNTKNRHLIFFF